MLPANVLFYGSPDPLPERVPLRAGPLSLVYQDGDLGEWLGIEGSQTVRVLPAVSSDPLRVEGLALAVGDAVCVLLANLTGEVQRVKVAGLAGDIRTRRLEERTAMQAMTAPGPFHDLGERKIVANGTALECDLLPYSVWTLSGR